MSKLFRILPVDKKSVEAFYDVYESLPDGSVRGFCVTETYRWGQGFRSIDDPVYAHEAKERVRCNPIDGWGAELDDLCAVYFEFNGEFTEEEQEEIKRLWDEGVDGQYGAGWLFDGEHNWEVEDDCIYIIGPVKIDIVDEDVYNEIIEENVQPAVMAISSAATAWPFEQKE